MAIKYKSVERAEPGIAGGGERKHYASIVRSEQVDLRKFMREIADRHSINMPDVIAVLESFMDLAGLYLLEGRTINMGQLGYFSPSIRSNPQESPEEVKRNSIRSFHVNFRPSILLKERLMSARFQKVSNGVEEPEEEVPAE
ncbi:MAG: hypothetical protein ABJG78_12200 [Cyclobacteriaceae bacterium]